MNAARKTTIAAAIVAMAATMAAPAPASQDAASTIPAAPAVRIDTPSGLPVPRFVSLKAEKTYCRAGPSFAHPVRITFMRRGLPVMVVAETTDHWRKIRDSEGDECWTHKTKLSSVRTAMVLKDRLALRSRPERNAPTRAFLGRGLVARVETSRDGWLRVSADGLKGWAPERDFWGGAQPQTFAAAQN